MVFESENLPHVVKGLVKDNLLIVKNMKGVKVAINISDTRARGLCAPFGARVLPSQTLLTMARVEHNHRRQALASDWWPPHDHRSVACVSLVGSPWSARPKSKYPWHDPYAFLKSRPKDLEETWLNHRGRRAAGNSRNPSRQGAYGGVDHLGKAKARSRVEGDEAGRWRRWCGREAEPRRRHSNRPVRGVSGACRRRDIR